MKRFSLIIIFCFLIVSFYGNDNKSSDEPVKKEKSEIENSLLFELQKELALNNQFFTIIELENIEKLTLNESCTDTLLEKLSALKNLKALTLHHCNISTKGLAHLSKLKSLEELAIQANHFSLIPGKDYQFFSKMQSLKKLDIGGLALTNEQIENIAKLNNLENLKLFGTKIDSKGIEIISKLVSLKSLNIFGTKELMLINKNKTGKVGEPIYNKDFLKPLKELKNLKSLTLNDIDIYNLSLQSISKLENLSYLSVNLKKTDAKGIALISKLKNLKILNLNRTKIFIKDIIRLQELLPECKLFVKIQISDLLYLNKLQSFEVYGFEKDELKMNNLKIKNRDVFYLRKLNDLKKLSLSQTKINDDGLIYLESQKNLEELDLSVKVNQQNEPDIKGHGLYELRKLANLKKLNLENTNVQDNELRHLKHLNSIEELNIHNPIISGAGLKYLNYLKKLRMLTVSVVVKDMYFNHLKDLKHLDTIIMTSSKSKPQFSGEGIQYLKDTALQYLRINEAKVNDKGMKYISEIENLRYLNLSSNNITDRGLEQLSKLQKLETLILSNNNITEAGLRHLYSLKQLKKLDISGYNFKYDDILLLKEQLADTEIKFSFNSKVLTVKELQRRLPLYELITTLKLKKSAFQYLKYYPNIENIELMGDISDEDLKGFATNAKLKSLIINSSNFNGLGLSYIENKKTLEYLDLSFTSLNDDNINHLKPFKHLKSLNISHSKITEKSIPKLIKFKQLESLNLMAVDLSKSSVSLLKESLPNTKIILWPKTKSEAVEMEYQKLSERDKLRLLQDSKEELLIYNQGWGRDIRTNYGLWGANKALLKSMGAKHPDSISIEIIEGVWEKVNKENQMK